MTTGLRTQVFRYHSEPIYTRMHYLVGEATELLFDTAVSGFRTELLERRIGGHRDVLFELTTTEGEIVAIHIAGQIRNTEAMEEDSATVSEDPDQTLVPNPNNIVYGDWIAVLKSRYDIPVPAVHIPQYRLRCYFGGIADPSCMVQFVSATRENAIMNVLTDTSIWCKHQGLARDFGITPFPQTLVDKTIPYQRTDPSELYLLFGRLVSKARDRNGILHHFEWQQRGFDATQPFPFEIDKKGFILHNHAEMLEYATSPEYNDRNYPLGCQFFFVYKPKRLQVYQYVRKPHPVFNPLRNQDGTQSGTQSQGQSQGQTQAILSRSRDRRLDSN